MPDHRRHRGPHPQDTELFGEESAGVLRTAVHELSWLRSRGYAEPSASKLVGDRHQLRARQRTAVGRCACTDAAASERASRCLDGPAVKGKRLAIDGLNVLTTVEVALAEGVLLIGRDACMRDMASFHGNYRLVHETERAITMVLGELDKLAPAEVKIYIDRPVSNSGRLAQAIVRGAEDHRVAVEPILSDRVDATLKQFDGVVATADSAILDACGPWVNLARLVVETCHATLPPTWVLRLG